MVRFGCGAPRARTPRTFRRYSMDARSRKYLSRPICLVRVGLAFMCTWVLLSVPLLGAEEIDEKALKEVREVVKHLQARYEKTKDLQADFTQRTTIEGFERPVTSSGRSISRSQAGYGGIISTRRSRTSMSIGMMSKCMCRSTNKYWLGSLHKWRPPRPRWSCCKGRASWRSRSTLSRHRERDVAWEESGYSPSCLRRVKVRRGDRYNGSC